MAMPKLIAVLNVTPDSFSDGGTLNPEAICAKAKALLEQGADILDVGAESTRPGGEPLEHEGEWARLEPVWDDLLKLCRLHKAEISLDSRHPETMVKALRYGVDIVNDVSGFNDQALRIMHDAECRMIVMHSLTIPASKEDTLPETVDVCEVIGNWIKEMHERFTHQGIASERLLFDPGIGFGKTRRQNWDLLSRVSEWRGMHPVVIGHSRKSFLTLFDDVEPASRDGLTRMLSAQLALQEVDYLRVHDVAGHRALFNQLYS